jgi:hypothetical protein
MVDSWRESKTLRNPQVRIGINVAPTYHIAAFEERNRPPTTFKRLM